MIIENFGINFLLELLLEMLPISSSGHLLMFSKFIPSITPLSFFYLHLSHVLIFFIQIFYVYPFFKILIYRKKWMIIFNLIINFISITIITGIIYLINHFLLKEMFEDYCFPLSSGFLISTFFLVLIYIFNKTRSRVYYQLSFKESIFFGLWQSIAFLPGVSRLATMLLGANLCKFHRKNALFIAITSNVAISGISLLYLLYYYYFIEKFSVIISQWLLFKLFLSLISSALLFIIFLNLFNKNKIIVFILYEFFVFLITYFVY